MDRPGDDPPFVSLAAAFPPGDDLHLFRAPGRVNLIGDHTDYQDGFCLPMAIDREVMVAARPRSDGRVVVGSLDLAGSVDVAADGSTEPADVLPTWGRTVAGVVRALASRGRPAAGLDAIVASTVPVGSGLSSSAAFEVGIALALADAAAHPLRRRDLVLSAQEAEHLATGVPCGVLDQMACVYGRAGHALLLDCRSLEVEPVTLPDELGVLVVHSGLPRALESSEYAQRRAACEEAAARLRLPALRDATPEQVADDPLARHVVGENARVLAFAEALRARDIGALGPLMLASHASLRDDFHVSTPELDLLVELLVDEGALGARLTGAGFGGCVVALVPAGRELEIGAGISGAYLDATGHVPDGFAVRAADGAGPFGMPSRG